MPPRIIAVRDRLRQDLAARLTPRAVTDASRHEGRRWRARRLDPVRTTYPAHGSAGPYFRRRQVGSISEN